MQSQHLQTTAYSTPLFENCLKAYPLSQSSATKYLMLPGQLADESLFGHNPSKFLCPSLSNYDQQCCFILLEGEGLDKYILRRGAQDRDVILTEVQIWNLVVSLTEAFCALEAAGCGGRLTHLKQYSVRKIEARDSYKLVYHESMVSQLQTASTRKWNSVYLSPEELGGEFVPQKSIIFSLGVLVLNLCAHRDRSRTIYHLDRFQVDQQIVKQKLQLTEKANGYSKLLCNFIEQCLIIDHADRYGFEEMRLFVRRKLERQYGRQSELMSQILGLQAGSRVLKYDIVMGQKPGQDATGFGSAEKKAEETGNGEPEKKEVQKSVENSTLKKKKSTKFQNLNRKKGQPKPKQDTQADERVVQHPVYQNIEYRGTFGERHVVETHQQQPSTIKRIKKVSPDSRADSTNQKQIDNSRQQEPAATRDPVPYYGRYMREDGETKIKIQPKSTSLKIEISYDQAKTKSEDSSENNEQPETPKGFARPKRTNYQKQFPKQQAQNNSEPAQDEYPRLITELKFLSLQECLRPKQELIRELNVMGVWVQGDIFYGNYEAGRRQGLGLQVFSNGEHYYGYFRQDMFSGEGFYCWANRDYFFGYFELGQKAWGRFEGQIRYQGGFKDNRRHGEGTCWYPTGEIYSGGWSHGRKHGRGSFQLQEGYRFRGTWVKGKRYGEGELEEDEKKICGFWNDQVIEGQALISYQNGDLYRGLLNQKLQKVDGLYISKSGRSFKGTFENDEPKKGELIYSNKDKYVGELLNSKRHGYGQYTYHENGQVYRGRWENGVRKD